MNSLFARLSIALLFVVGLLGGSFFLLTQVVTRVYYEEVTQRLNAPIAGYVTSERQLISGGRTDREALAELAQQAMIINPSVEVYLLDRRGRIIGHALPPESVVTDRVDLGPVQALIDGDGDMPLRGTDPRNRDSRKIFSAYPVEDGGELQGYLYAVLGGQKFDMLADSLRGGYLQRMTLGALVALALGAFLVGLLVFGLLTRRLVRLTGDVRRFTESGFDPGGITRLADPAASGGGGDEIAQLRAAFSAMAEKIGEQFDSLKETDRLRRELITNVSHDLRTPLASMHGYVETLLIRNERLSPELRRRYLEITHRHTQRLTQLVGDLFELAKLESAGVRPVLEHFPLAELLQDVAQEFELEAQQKDIRLAVDAPPAPATVYADIGLMQRVLENLIRNAMKFTPRGGDIRVSVEDRPDSVAVAVADTGRGISPDELENIFDRFYASGEGGGDGECSTGLGLAIVRRILDLHGSRITVTSEVDRGTRFEFALPTGKAA